MVIARVGDSVVKSDDCNAVQEHAQGLAEIMAEYCLEGTTDKDTIIIEVCGVKYECTTDYSQLPPV